MRLPEGLVWVTRAEPAASQTGAALQALGALPLVAPLIATRALATPAPLPLDAVRALAFTSAAGVRALAARLSAVELRALTGRPAFAVGSATAVAARAAGFADVTDAQGDVAGLAQAIRTALGAQEVEGLLHPCAQAVAAPLPGVVAWPLYATAPSTSHHATVLQALAQGAIRAVLVQSPSAGRALAYFATRVAPPGALATLAIHAQSGACAAPLRALGAMAIRIAPHPTQADLLPAAATAALASAAPGVTDRTLPQGPP